MIIYILPSFSKKEVNHNQLVFGTTI